ncbi:hypothetical protein [Chryseobacterium salivictor]|uniref:Uncharacterized protein n=1 Tax=Chryseobacterium salivictor TaxID=2547600 RepID=A0A4P6ZHF3_9FLAO|nr:hypothetical protein [Chryseobacterium salivictor]QBO59200.1 hypothetical protein NBC122_02396 [Chryseobacterium salivictor]
MKLVSFLLILSLLFGCDREKSIQEVTKTDLLTSSEWKKDYYVDSYYYNNILENQIKDETNKGVEAIKFNVDLTVNYLNPALIDKVNGNWNFDNNETIVKTNLTKFGFIFFASQKINVLDENSLMFELEHRAIVSFNPNGTEKISILVRKLYFTH